MASTRHRAGDAERVIDLPVPAERFPTEADAEAHGLRIAREYSEANLPHGA